MPQTCFCYNSGLGWPFLDYYTFPDSPFLSSLTGIGRPKSSERPDGYFLKWVRALPNWPEGPVRPFMKGIRTEKGPSGPSGEFGPVRAFSKKTVLNRQQCPKIAKKPIILGIPKNPIFHRKISERGFREGIIVQKRTTEAGVRAKVILFH